MVHYCWHGQKLHLFFFLCKCSTFFAARFMKSGPGFSALLFLCMCVLKVGTVSAFAWRYSKLQQSQNKSWYFVCLFYYCCILVPQNLQAGHPTAPFIREFLILMSVCHTVIPEKAYDSKIHYHAASPGRKLVRAGIKLNQYYWDVFCSKSHMRRLKLTLQRLF